MLLSIAFYAPASGQSRVVVVGSDTSYAVPRAMLADYLNITTVTVPAMLVLQSTYREALAQDSVLIASLRGERDALRRQIQTGHSVAALYEGEIAKRKQVENLYRAELRRVKRWRAFTAVALVAGVVVALVK